MLFEIIVGTILFSCGLIFVISPIASKSKPLRWALTSFIIVGVLMMVMVYGTLTILTSPHLVFFNNEDWRLLFVHYRGTVGGIALGILLTLVIAGQFKNSAWKFKQNEPPTNHERPS